jgi:acetylornithine deacetylase/succinyl-diaminopimelate desuccinylase-like protein
MLPGSRVADADAQIDRWVKEYHVSRRLKVRSPESVATPAEGPAWRAALDVFSLEPEHAPVGPYVLSGQYTASAPLRARGLRAYGISPFAVNIFDAGTIHHENERISVPLFVDGVERMKRLVREFATAP